MKLLVVSSTHFLSIDIDFHNLNSKNIQTIQNYNRLIHQIRIIIEEPIENIRSNSFLAKIKNKYSGSKILFYKIPWTFIDKNFLTAIIKNSHKFNFTPSLLPIGTEDNSQKYRLFIKLLSKFKKDIKTGKLLIDSPGIIKEIIGKDYFCPANNLMCHIDSKGYFRHCKFDNYCLGNIKNETIDNLWKNKNQVIKKYLKNKRSINRCLADRLIRPPYSVFATVYDRLMRERKNLYNEYVEFIKFNFPNKKIKILDIACGTGELIKKLGYIYNNIEGIELSKEMINLSRKKTFKKIYQADMTNFKLKRRYNLILCTFDSLNYLLNKNSIKRSFKNFYNHLERGGSLIFDINTLKKFKKHRDQIKELKINKLKIRWISSYNRPFWKIIMIISLNNATSQEIHYERFYPLYVIKKMLKECKFTNIKYFNGSLINPGINNKRVFFIASK